MQVSGVVLDGLRHTIVKTRVIARHQQIVRIDREAWLDPDEGQKREFVAHLERVVPEVDAIILSDYAKGFLGQWFVDACRTLAVRHKKVVTVDPSPKNPIDWAGVTALKPNLKEARQSAGLGDRATAEEAGAVLLGRLQGAMLLLTLGEHGMLLLCQGQAPFHTPTRAREVFDVSGAGDTAIAVFTLALAARATPEEAAELANHASGVAVGKLGTATVTADELVESVRSTHGA